MKTFHFLFLVCAFLVSACGSTPTVQVLPSLEPMPLVVTPSLTPSPLPPPTFTVTPMPTQPAFESVYTADQISPIFYESSFHSFILLGATASGVWVHPNEVYGLLYDDRMYDLYFDNELIGSGLAHVKSTENYGPPGTCEYHDVDQSLTGGEPPSFGFKQGQPVVIRPVEDISIDSATYQQVVEDWLILQEVPNPVVNITRILRTDIEGDGVDEMFISASHFVEESGHMVVVGDYSVVLMRKVVGGEVYTTPLVADIYRNDPAVLRFPPTYLLDTAFDLNGDGRLEVIVAGTWWEGGGVNVYEIHGIGSDEVLHVGCGLVAQN